MEPNIRKMEEGVFGVKRAAHRSSSKGAELSQASPSPRIEIAVTLAQQYSWARAIRSRSRLQRSAHARKDLESAARSPRLLLRRKSQGLVISAGTFHNP